MSFLISLDIVGEDNFKARDFSLALFFVNNPIYNYYIIDTRDRESKRDSLSVIMKRGDIMRLTEKARALNFGAQVPTWTPEDEAYLQAVIQGTPELKKSTSH